MRFTMNILSLRFTLCTILLALTACGRQSNEDIITDAYHDYQIMLMRYEDLLLAVDDRDIIEQTRLLGLNQSLSFGSSLWESFCGNDYLVVSSGAPLHKAVYFISRDINLLEKYVYNFERRGLFNKPLYEKIVKLRRNLCEIIALLQSQKDYSQESQFIEQQQVQKSQLHEQRKQTNLLGQLVEKDDSKKYKAKKRSREYVKVESYNIFI